MSDASTFDEVCIYCGAHDEVPGGWGQLEFPCPNAPKDDRVLHYGWAELLDLRKEVESLRHALEESVKLQSHYAELLNMYDGGQRMQFTTLGWIKRLSEMGKK